MLIFWFLTTYDSGFVWELEPGDGIHEPQWKATLTIFFIFDVLEKRVKKQVKRAEVITLKNATTNGYKRSAKLIGSYRRFEISVQAFKQKFDLIKNVVIIKSGLKRVMMNFTKSVFEV